MTAAKKKAAKKPPAKTPQVDRSRTVSPNEVREENGFPAREETEEERHAAGLAREKKARTPGKDPMPDYEPKHLDLPSAGFDHYSAEEKRQAELQRERDVHNARTGDASRQ